MRDRSTPRTSTLPTSVPAGHPCHARVERSSAAEPALRWGSGSAVRSSARSRRPISLAARAVERDHDLARGRGAARARGAARVRRVDRARRCRGARVDRRGRQDALVRRIRDLARRDETYAIERARTRAARMRPAAAHAAAVVHHVERRPAPALTADRWPRLATVHAAGRSLLGARLSDRRHRDRRARGQRVPEPEAAQRRRGVSPVRPVVRRERDIRRRGGASVERRERDRAVALVREGTRRERGCEEHDGTESMHGGSREHATCRRSFSPPVWASVAARRSSAARAGTRAS